MPRWLARHRLLAAFAAGVGLTLLALAAAGYWVLSDQRRSARALAAALSAALAREVRIERVTDLGTQRVVMRGVALPREGGWPATIVAERVEADGPLLAAARGDAAPVRLTVVRPTLELPAGGGGDLPAALGGVRDAVRRLLASPLLLDLTLSGGRALPGGITVDLNLLKGAREAKGTLTARAGGGRPLTLRLDARLDGDTARLALAGQGPLAPVAGWLPAAAATALGGAAVDLRVDADLGSRESVARVHVGGGAGLEAAGTLTVAGDAVTLQLSRASADLGTAAGLGGLAWRPTGRAELSEASATWEAGRAGWPTVRATLRVPALTLPAAGAGVDVAGERVEATLRLAPGPPAALTGEARLARVRAAGLDGGPVETRYRIGLESDGRVARIELTDLRGRAEGAALQGEATYDGATGRLDARLEGEQVEAADLVRRLLPGWLGASDRLRLAGLRVAATGLEPRTLAQGSTRLEARGFEWVRPRGRLTGARLDARSEFAPGAARTAVDARGIVSTLGMLPGTIPALALSAEVTHAAEAGWQPRRGEVVARDAAGREMLVATLSPGGAPGALRLAARVPALERLAGLWPDVPRTLNGSARLDVEMPGGSPAVADGRLTLSVPEGELTEGRVSIRDLEADLPIRRGPDTGGEPPWGRIAAGELIGYGVVVRDLATPARIWHDRLSVNQLAYVLYSGTGDGWAEVEWEPAGLSARGTLHGRGVRIEEFMSAYGIRGGTMTGLLGYALDYHYQAGRLALNGRFEVPEGGTVNIQLLERLLGYADVDPTGVVRRALENLRAFDYKDATAEVRSAGNDIRVSLSLRGRERFLVFPPKVKEINVRNMPLSFLARQFPGS